MSNKTKMREAQKTITTTVTFLPTSIAGCSMWLDGADPAGTAVVPASGTLATWADKSGSGNNATQSTSGNQPTYSSNGLVFAGSQWFQTPITSFPSAETIFIVFKSSTAVADIFAGTSGSSREVLLYTGSKIYLGRYGTDPSSSTPNSGAISLNTSLIYCIQYTSSAVAFNVNGTTTGSGTPAFTFSGSGTSWIGSSGYSPNNMNGTIYEFIYYNSSINTTNRQTVESYLAQKWGLTASLPTGHPGLTTTVYGTVAVAPTVRQKIRMIPPATVLVSYTQAFAYTGANQTFAVPATTTSITVYMWGAGGAGGYSGVGGAGAYLQGVLSVTPGSSLRVIVGQGGTVNGTSAFGGGGVGSVAWQGGGGGGGYSGIFNGSTPLVIVGAGGGAAFYSAVGGCGDSVTGTGIRGTTSGSTQSGYGGTQSAGGAAGTGALANGSPGTYLAGGAGDPANSSGGGAGYYGGGGGGTSDYIGGSGGGGSSYSTLLTSIVASNSPNTGMNAPNTSSTYYVSGIAVGGSGYTVVGGDGRVVLVYGAASAPAPTVKQKIGYIAPSVAIVVAPTVYTVTTSGLVYYLDAAQTASYPGSGSTWSNLVGSGNAVTLYNSPTYSASGGGSLLFDGTTQYGRSVSPVNLPNWTMEAWYYYNGGSTGGNIVVDMFPSAMQYTLGSFSGGWLSTGTYSPTANTSAYVPISGNWYHIVGTYDGTNLKLYINGAVVYIKAISITPSNGGVGFQIMTQYDTNHSSYLAGNLAILRMYNRGLTTIEVNANYNAERSRFSLTSVNSPISYTIPSVSFVTSGLSFYIDISIQACYYNSSAATLYDLTGSSMVITLYNSPTYSTSGGGSLLFNGTSQYGRSSAPLLLTNWTMEAWYYYNGGSTGGNIVVDMFPSSMQYILGSFGGGFLSTGTYSPTSSTSAYTLTSGNWYHAAGTYDGTNLKLYVNGVLVYFKTITITPSNSGIGFQIMTQYDISHSSYLAGNLAILRMYNRALSATEINTNYNAERARFSLAYVSPPISYTIPSVSFSTSGLSFYIDIAIQASYYNSSATTLYDLTGSSMVITLYNSPTYSTAGGGCLIFNGTTQYGRSSAPLPLTNWTIEAWYYYSGGSTGGNIVVDIFSSTMQYILGSFGGGWISAGMYSPSANTGTFTPISGNWYQVVGTYDGVNVKLYINGALSSSVASTGRPANGGTGFHIMTQYDTNHSSYLAGNLAILRMYNSALILSEVTQNYNAEKSRFGLT